METAALILIPRQHSKGMRHLYRLQIPSCALIINFFFYLLDLRQLGKKFSFPFFCLIKISLMFTWNFIFMPHLFRAKLRK